MTVTIVYGAADDGYLYSYNASYATSRNGPATGVTAGSSNTNYYGQNGNDSSYANFQAMIRFTFTALPATEMVTAAAVCLYQSVQFSTSVARNMEVRGYSWSGSGLTTADWRNPTQLAACVLYGQVNNVQNSVGKMTAAGSDELVALIQTGQNYLEFVVVSSRQRAGNTPTVDEGSAFYSADAGGTANDPTVVWSSFVRTHFTPAIGGMAQLSDGSTVFLNGNGVQVPTSLTLYRRDTSGAGAATIGTVGTTTNTYDVAPAKGNQGITLCVDSADNIYVVGKRGSSENELWVKCWAKNPGVWTWTPGSARIIALPTYDTAINNVSACWHPANNGTLMVVAGHAPGAGVSGGTGNELAWALVDATYVRTGTGTLVRATGSLLGTILAAATSAEFNTYANEVGTGLDVVADAVQPNWGYVLSLKKGQLLGENSDLDCGRYVLNAAGNGFAHTSYQSGVGWGVKDASAKVRLLAVGDGQVVTVTPDDDSGWGLSVFAWQAQGTSAGLVELGGAILSGEDIASMPAGNIIAPTNHWDAIYNSADNSVWVYYRHASIPGRLMRTSLSLNSGNATRLEIQVADVTPLTITGVRVARNGNVSQKGLVGITTVDGSAVLARQEIVDAFNIAPTAPTLTPKANYDASAAATFAWTFSDPNPGDTQSAYRLEIRRVDTDAVVVDTGKVTSTVASRNVTGGTLVNGLDYRWRVKVWDAQDLDSTYAAWGTFSTNAGGTVTITDPAVDNPYAVVTDEIQVSWSAAGTVQTAYRVILVRNDTAATVSDTGWVTSTATSHLVTGMVTGVEHQVQVRVRNASMVTSGLGTRLITPNYGTPEVPLLTVQPVPDEGYVLVTVDNPLSGQPEAGTQVLDMEVSTTGWTAWFGTKAEDTVIFRSGAKSLKLTATGGQPQAYIRHPALEGLVIPTERYTARMWVYVPVARTVSASIDWHGPTWNYLATNALDFAVPATTWTEIQVTGTAPDGADRISFGPTLGGTPGAGVAVYLDDAIVVAASDRPAVVRNRILRRKLDSGDPWEVVGTADPDGSFRDYTAPGRVPLEYVARGESA